MNFKRPNKETVLLYSSEGRSASALYKWICYYIIIIIRRFCFHLLYQLHADCQFEV